jgi:menaquinone-dependent protoporphyrinogen oxidase
METPSYQYGEKAADIKVLVAYATRTGSTVGVAAAVGEVLGKRGYFVDVKPIQENPIPDAYDFVILGSAINGGQWLPEALAYIEEHQQAIRSKQAAVFSVHIMNLGSDEKSAQNRLAYLDKVNALIQPMDAAFFAGLGMLAEKEPAITRWVYRTFKIGPEGDCRDWKKIRAWAETIDL